MPTREAVRRNCIAKPGPDSAVGFAGLTTLVGVGARPNTAPCTGAGIACLLFARFRPRNGFVGFVSNSRNHGGRI